MSEQVVRDVLEGGGGFAAAPKDTTTDSPRDSGNRGKDAYPHSPDVNAALSMSFEPGSRSPVNDPDAPKFVINESAFRGPLQFGGTSPRSRGKRRNSWLSNNGLADDGFRRRWVDEPLKLVEDEDASTSGGSPHVARRSNKLQGPDEESARAELTTLATPRPLASTLNTVSRMQEPRPPTNDPGPSNRETDQNRGHFRKASNTDHLPASRLASRRWAIIRSRLVPTHADPRGGGAASAVAPDLNISDELLGGGLAALMLKMHFDRDEQNRRRVPVLLHHLKIRVSDSVQPLKGTHATFRIEVM